MSRSSKRFEQLVHRINELLQGDGANVQWDDRILDPDSPKRRRQIDVSIRRDGLFTIIECREHAEPQDAQWIEELIGRRISLRADAIVAVSSSGFTSTALKKAAAHGVATRQLQELTDEEIAGWGRALRVKLYFARFESVALDVGWRGDEWPTEAQLQAALARVANTLFNPAAPLLQEGRTIDETVTIGKANFGYTMEFPETLEIGSGRSPWIAVKGVVWLEVVGAIRPVVKAYGGDRNQSMEAVVQSFGLGETSVIHADRAKVSCIIDLRDIQMPPLSQFRYAQFESDHENEYARLEVIGADRILTLGSVHLTVVRA